MLPAKIGSILPNSFRGEDFFKQSPIRNKNCPWQPYLLAEWDEMKILYRGPYIDAFCQVWFHLAQLFQRSRLKYEKVNWRTTDAKWWQWSGELKTIIWPWGQRSRSHKGHYGMWHTTLWSCTHIPNIIDLSGKTKKLWSRQASLRRSGRKNQTKTIYLPSFEGET
jgi:hypothetical protein